MPLEPIVIFWAVGYQWEGSIHKLLGKYRSHGEWFAITPKEFIHKVVPVVNRRIKDMRLDSHGEITLP